MKDINSTDATQSLRVRVETRARELEAVVVRMAPGDARLDVERALDAIDRLLTGYLDAIPSIVSMQLGEWLEHNKHLAEQPAPLERPPTSTPGTYVATPAAPTPDRILDLPPIN